MKRKTISAMVALTGSLAYVGLSVANASEGGAESGGAVAVEQQGAGDSAASAEETGSASRDATLLERRKAEIMRRLGMSAPLEVELIGGVDSVEELEKEGRIIEATLEQVEAAIEAAKRTQDPQDDIEALILKHRGSYRYYVTE